MEVGHITPVHKKGSKNLMENYRQITLTCIVCKIAETVVGTLVVAFGQRIGIFKELEFQLIVLFQNARRRDMEKMGQKYPPLYFQSRTR